jgi:mRNA-degrading endonuclease toxin of MazEF toxin-antitoxin module
MNRGDVVEVDWPYSDMSGSKTRPAVVVQADFLNSLIDDTILVQITSRRHGIPGTEVLLDPAVEAGSGLSKVCVAS